MYILHNISLLFNYGFIGMESKRLLAIFRQLAQNAFSLHYFVCSFLYNQSKKLALQSFIYLFLNKFLPNFHHYLINFICFHLNNYFHNYKTQCPHQISRKSSLCADQRLIIWWTRMSSQRSKHCKLFANDEEKLVSFKFHVSDCTDRYEHTDER